MHNVYAYQLIQPCKNRGLDFKDNKDGTVTIDGKIFETIKECDEYLASKSRVDFKIAATMNDCRQYSDSDFESFQHIKIVDTDTTIGDLIKWQREKFPERVHANIEIGCGRSMLPIHLLVAD